MLSLSLNVSFVYSLTGITRNEGLRTGGFLENMCTVIFPERTPEEHSGGLWFSNVDILGKVLEELKCC